MGYELNLDKFEKLIPEDILYDDLEIDLRECDWISPQGAMGLFLLLRYYIQQGKSPIVFCPINRDVHNYLERTGTYIRTYENVNYVPSVGDVIKNNWYASDSMGDITELVNDAQVADIIGKFRNAMSLQISDKTKVTKMSSSILEIFQNIPLHANPLDDSSLEGYVNIQSYKNSGKVIICAGDLGIGIRTSLLTNKTMEKNEMSHLEAINKATEEKISRFSGTKRKDHGGGLMRAIELVRSVNGYIYVRSGTAMIVWGPKEMKFEKSELKHFPGTQIIIRISE